LGYLNADYFLGGRMQLSTHAAREAIRSHVARPLGLDDIEAAWGIHETVNETMATALRIHVAEKGRDPRQHALVATGGAGPVHAYGVAQKVGVSRIVSPRAAGVASALGLLVAAPRMELVRTYATRLDDVNWETLNELYGELEAQITAILSETGLREDEISFARLAHMRYVGQGHEIEVPITADELVQQDLDTLTESFHAVYEQFYGQSARDVPVEALNWRLIGSGPSPELDAMLRARVSSRDETGAALKGSRQAYFPDANGFIQVDVYDRYEMGPGWSREGPAIIEEMESTVIAGPRAVCEIDDWGNLIIEMRK
jgi:N-methylhydantoinase A